MTLLDVYLNDIKEHALKNLCPMAIVKLHDGAENPKDTGTCLIEVDKLDRDCRGCWNQQWYEPPKKEKAEEVEEIEK